QDLPSRFLPFARGRKPTPAEFKEIPAPVHPIDVRTDIFRHDLSSDPQEIQGTAYDLPGVIVRLAALCGPKGEKGVNFGVRQTKPACTESRFHALMVQYERKPRVLEGNTRLFHRRASLVDNILDPLPVDLRKGGDVPD
ncbi:hypothetical protein, partial [Roseibium sp. RKSG952]|uniref:hypothetical protein n=1 Tax=Roseibium sp. RKSG952 TaxID=2529384 RepID=UPI001AD8EE98